MNDKVGSGQLIGMIVMIMMMMIMMIGLSSCPVKTRNRREIKQLEIFLFLFFVFIAMEVAGAPLIAAVGNITRPAALNDVSFQASYFFCLFQVNSLFFREEKEKWIRAKYEGKEFLQELPPSDFSLGEVSIQFDVSSFKDSLHLDCG